jgi:hypothetical protein
MEVEIDDKVIKPGKEFRIGYEATASGTSPILSLGLGSKEPASQSRAQWGKMMNCSSEKQECLL